MILFFVEYLVRQSKFPPELDKNQMDLQGSQESQPLSRGKLKSGYPTLLLCDLSSIYEFFEFFPIFSSSERIRNLVD